MLTSLRRLRFRRLAEDAGLTLVEVAVVVGLLGVVLVPAFMYLSSVQRGEARISNATQQDTQARLAMERLSRTLREAQYPQNQDYTTSALFDSVAANDVKFYSNANNDSDIEQTRFYLSGTTLYKTVVVPDPNLSPLYSGPASAPSPIIENVQNGVAGKCGRPATGTGSTSPLFQYFTKEDPATPVTYPVSADTITSINKVQIQLDVQIPSVNAPACQTLSTFVELRNRVGK
jgi:type II secretory pathway component PulJ